MKKDWAIKKAKEIADKWGGLPKWVDYRKGSKDPDYVTDSCERDFTKALLEAEKNGMEHAVKITLSETKMRAGGCSVQSENHRRAVEEAGKRIAEKIQIEIVKIK